MEEENIKNVQILRFKKKIKNNIDDDLSAIVILLTTCNLFRKKVNRNKLKQTFTYILIVVFNGREGDGMPPPRNSFGFPDTKGGEGFLHNDKEKRM